MASRTGYVASALAVLTAADFEKMPKGVIAFDNGGTGSTVTASGLDLVSESVTVGSGRLLKILGRGQIINGGTSSGGTINIYEGGTDLGRVHRHEDGATESYCSGFVVVDAPSAGSHTYKIRADTTGGTFDTFGDFTIFVEDMGPSSASW